MSSRREWELALVGAMLLSERAVEDVYLKPERFLYDDCRKAYEAIQSVYVTTGTVDVIAVKVALGNTDAAHLFLASAADHCTNASHAAMYARQIEGQSFAQEYAEWLAEGSSLTGLDEIQSHSERMPKFTGGEPLLDIAKVGLPGALDGVTTGFRCLDHLTHGAGWVAGQTSVVSAYTKGGKTAAMLQSLGAAARRFLADGSDRIAVYATFADLSPERLVQRMLTEECGSRYVDSTLAAEALRDLRSLPVKFYNARTHGRQVEALATKARTAHYKRPVGIVFCDYAQKMGTFDKCDSEVGRMTTVSSKLDELADRLYIPVVLGSQITVNADGSVTTKYARAIEEDAGFVLRIKRKEGECSFEVPLNRHGPGERKQEMAWNERTLTFDEPEPLAQEQDRRYGT